MRPSQLWAAAAVALGVTVTACSGGSEVADGPYRRLAADHDRGPGGRTRFVGADSRSPKLRPTRSACAATASRTSPTRC